MSDTETGRTRRQKVDKTGRLSALERLKQLKGSKRKYEVEELENVYEEVDEKEYTKTVIERQSDNWIVDDGGSGYVEDGREIFDDDLDDGSIQEAKRHRLSGPRKKKEDSAKKKGNIQNLLLNMSSKKKADTNVYDDDDVLADLLSELAENNSSKKPFPVPVKNKFCSTPRSNERTNQAEPRPSTSKDDIMLDTNKSDDPGDMVIFEKPKATNMSNNSELISNTESNIENKTGQQRTEHPSNEINTTSKMNSSMVLSTQENKNGGNLDMDAEIEDLSEFADELFNTDFDYEALNIPTKPRTPPIQESKPNLEDIQDIQKQPEEIQKEDSKVDDFNELFDNESDFELSKLVLPECTLDLPIVKNKDNEDVLRIFWWDAYEDPYKQPGTVYLFGKVHNPPIKEHCSCCVTVKNIPRRIYLLPRVKITKNEEDDTEQTELLTTMEDVYNEFNNYANKIGIKEFRSSRVTKWYAFEHEDTPMQCEYLEVRYDTCYPAMPSDYSGPAIQHVFGTTVNALELLLLERHIKGPCWLEIKDPVPTATATSWCKVKANCLKFENISVCEELQKVYPPLVVSAVNVRSTLNVKTNAGQIVMIVILTHYRYFLDKQPPKPRYQHHTCLFTRPRDMFWPRQRRLKLTSNRYTTFLQFDTETELLEKFLDILTATDPDLLIVYDQPYQYEFVLNRILTLKVSNWSRLGRLKRTTAPYMKGKLNMYQVFAGRPVCDIKLSAKELNLKVRDYELATICGEVLKLREEDCRDIKPDETPTYYRTVDGVEDLMQKTMNEILNTLTIVYELNIILLTYQITCLSGYVISRTLLGGRAERNEYLLLHAFHARHYITPDRRINRKTKNEEGGTARKKAAYAGGLVLEPKKGFYDKLVVLMDFNSLYPSIILEYNLCFVTVPGCAYVEVPVKDLTFPASNVPLGVIPSEIRKLVESRKQVKEVMSAPKITPELKMQYHIKQLALKLTANSMYGCLGATHCRFYAKGLASMITAYGRHLLEFTKKIVEKQNYEVVYGDTDSLMINTKLLNYEDAFNIGKKIKREVNKYFKKIELGIDGIFRYLLLLQKKKYAAVMMVKAPDGQIKLVNEYKGLDIVRRDWCPLACNIGKRILDELMSDKVNENRIENIQNMLQQLANDVRSGEAPLSLFVLTKQLSKDPQDYTGSKPPHVQIALRMNEQPGRKLKAGSTVSYIICDDGTNFSATSRAYHIDEYKKSDSLKIDVKYYLLSQVYPVVLRICEPIPGLGSKSLVKFLGLEPYYKLKGDQRDMKTEIDKKGVKDPYDRFKNCCPLTFNCMAIDCTATIEIKQATIKTEDDEKLSLTSCSNPNCNVPPWKYANTIQNKITLDIRKAINEYYKGTMECMNPLCEEETIQLPLDFASKYPKCTECGDKLMQIVRGRTLYTQVLYYQRLFDLSKIENAQLLSQIPQDMRDVYDDLKEAVQVVLDKSEFYWVSLESYFPLLDEEGQIINEVNDSVRDVVVDNDDTAFEDFLAYDFEYPES